MPVSPYHTLREEGRRTGDSVITWLYLRLESRGHPARIIAASPGNSRISGRAPGGSAGGRAGQPLAHSLSEYSSACPGAGTVYPATECCAAGAAFSVP